MHISNLISYIEPIGRRLKIIDGFPEGEEAITDFSVVGDLKETI